jgi:hypothetical protein
VPPLSSELESTIAFFETICFKLQSANAASHGRRSAPVTAAHPDRLTGRRGTGTPGHPPPFAKVGGTVRAGKVLQVQLLVAAEVV